MNNFVINIDDKILDDLNYRLDRVRWPDEIPGSGWTHGTNLDYLKELVEYWKTDFDWRKHEDSLNKFNHFTSDIEDFNIHFIHEKSPNENPIPIVITHGWPSTFYEMHKIIPLLTNPEINGGDPKDSFNVVAPSLPGYGFSSRPTKLGLNVRETAKLWNSLMIDTLGYQKYAAHGGDIGAGVTTQLGYLYSNSDNIIGLHFTALNRPGPYLGEGSKELTEAEIAHINQQEKWYHEEAAYNRMHSTRPQTLAYGLNDSPIGLAGWIVEKFRAWSDCDGDIESRFSKDDLLINLTIYWATETINSSTRMYFENYPLTGGSFEKSDKITIPTAGAIFPHDISTPPREWAERSYNIVHWTEMPKGGHFAAMEEPEMLVNDIRDFFRPLRN
jgi:pimeloyl-ACP methyl ester carboxylesterase